MAQGVIASKPLFSRNSEIKKLFNVRALVLYLDFSESFKRGCYCSLSIENYWQPFQESLDFWRISYKLVLIATNECLKDFRDTILVDNSLADLTPGSSATFKTFLLPSTQCKVLLQMFNFGVIFASVFIMRNFLFLDLLLARITVYAI